MVEKRKKINMVLMKFLFSIEWSYKICLVVRPINFKVLDFSFLIAPYGTQPSCNPCFSAAVLLAAQTRDPASEARRAQELLAAGKADEAVGVYRDLVRASPRNAVLLLNLCIAEYKAKQYAETVLHAAAALQLQPDLLPARLFLGAGQLELGEFAKAEEPLAKVVAEDPRERNARLMLGEALLGMGKPGEAVGHLQAAAGMLPDNPRAWYGLGRAYEALERSEAATEAWNRLAGLPASVESHMHAAEVHDREQRWREAAVEWRAAIEHRGARVSLAWSLFRARDYDEAIAVLKPLAPAANASSAGVQFLLGASLLNLQQPAEAIPYLRAAIARDAKLLPARAALGQALLQTGQAAEAIPFLKDGAAVDTDGTIHFQLFRAYQLTHREAEAREALAAYRSVTGKI